MDLMKSLLLWRTINARNARIDVNPRPFIPSALEDQPRRNLRYCPSVELSRLVDGLRPQFQGIRLFRTLLGIIISDELFTCCQRSCRMYPQHEIT
jgi:hypothetical protein